MRKVLIILAVLIACIAAMLAAWIFGGRQLSLFIDRFETIEIDSAKVTLIAYEGSGTGGVLIVNKLELSLNETAPNLSPSIGSSKDNQFALASGGKVFAFGPLAPGERLATAPPVGDDASLETRRSILSWPTPFDFNFMTGQAPLWKRHVYYQLRWRKSSGATLDILWRYEQNFYPSQGWGGGFVTREGSTGLVRLEIKE
ncbi:MAG: hypothetical protein DME33_08425 [Verrucomicrobia bacterium]|nr:MAG: hypothetical protein DME33_08425 [Verrucomicrobiota bacterium]